MMKGSEETMAPSPYFSQVFILKIVKVLCFDTLLQVFILKVVSPPIDPFGLEMTMNRARLVKCGDHGLDYSAGKLTTTVRRDRRGASVLFCATRKENSDDGSGSREGAEGKRD